MFATWLAQSASASAFSNISFYGKYQQEQLGAGGGRYFTGSPADGYSCSVCHSAPEKYSFPVIQKGLPLNGYVPGEPYKVELNWPKATEVEAEALAKGWTPQIEIVVELVSEEGGSAGTVAFAGDAELNPAVFPGAYCTGLPGTPPEKLKHAMRIFEVESGKRTLETERDTLDKDGKRPTCTTGGEDGKTRCVLALTPCGAKSMKFMWTAPKKWRGPIWFSAGFVMAYDKSSEPDDGDYVTELSIPMNAAYEGSMYSTVMESGCSLVRGPVSRRGAGGMAAAWLGVLASVQLMRRRRRASEQRSSIWLLAAAIALLCCVGCTEKTKLVTEVTGNVGIFEPAECGNCSAEIKCRMSLWDTDAAVAMEMEPMKAAGADAPVTGMNAAAAGAEAAGGAGQPGSTAPTGAAATGNAPAFPIPQALQLAAAGAGADSALQGTVAIELTTTQAPGTVSQYEKDFAPGSKPYYLAVWIESDAHLYVRTLWVIQKGFAPISLKYWKELGADCQKMKEKPDVVAAATPAMHQTYSLKWDGMMGNGMPAPAGMYRLRMELKIDEDPGKEMDIADIPFMFGPGAMPFVAPPMLPHAGVSFTFTPSTN